MDNKHIALVLPVRLQENLGILDGITEYERAHAEWRFFLDDQTVSATDPKWLFTRKFDGVICRHASTQLLEYCIEHGVPCVDLEDSGNRLAGAPKLRPDNVAIGHMGGEHFLDRGYGHFGFCGFSSENWACERRKGIVEAIEAVGLKCEVMETEYPKVLTPYWDLGEQALMQAWLEDLPTPIGIMCCNDLRALQLVEAVHDVGLSIPEEVAILGVNNETCRVKLSRPALSSIEVNLKEWGFKAAQAIDHLLNGKSYPDESFIEPLPVVVRRSTDTYAVDDPVIAKALKIIKSEACQTLRVDDLARRVNVSRSGLERRFRKLLRRTPQEEIRSFKINRVKQLLLETEMSLAEIAETTGFEHPEYLSVMFKRLTGESPRDYRQRSKPAKGQKS
jgi:LacI family transcriptional regulator